MENRARRRTLPVLQLEPESPSWLQISSPGCGVPRPHIASTIQSASFPLNHPHTRGLMPETTQKRRNRVFKSLHKPLTYMGIERTLFFMVCVSAVGMFNLFNSIISGIIVFIGGAIFGHWVTNSDPAFLKILGRSEKFKLRYDAAKQRVPNVEVR